LLGVSRAVRAVRAVAGPLLQAARCTAQQAVTGGTSCGGMPALRGCAPLTAPPPLSLRPSDLLAEDVPPLCTVPSACAHVARGHTCCWLPPQALKGALQTLQPVLSKVLLRDHGEAWAAIQRNALRAAPAAARGAVPGATALGVR
jgi:hypothetical protein